MDSGIEKVVVKYDDGKFVVESDIADQVFYKKDELFKYLYELKQEGTMVYTNLEPKMINDFYKAMIKYHNENSKI